MPSFLLCKFFEPLRSSTMMFCPAPRKLGLRQAAAMFIGRMLLVNLGWPQADSAQRPAAAHRLNF